MSAPRFSNLVIVAVPANGSPLAKKVPDTGTDRARACSAFAGIPLPSISRIARPDTFCSKLFMRNFLSPFVVDLQLREWPVRTRSVVVRGPSCVDQGERWAG